jgi:hypothetical protein
MANGLETLAGSIPSWGAKLAYGDKTTLDGLELLPVAVVVFGFGAGEGSGELPDDDLGPARKGEGSGGGGGGYSIPIGAYANGPDGLAFRANPIALVAVSALLVSVVAGALVRVIRAAG